MKLAAATCCAAAAAAATLLGGASAADDAAAAGTIGVVESSEAGAQWTSMPALHWGADDFASPVAVTTDLAHKKQSIMGFGSAMTDTSAYNAEVWMNDKTKTEYFEALWGATGLGLTIGRVTLYGSKHASSP